MKIYKKIAYVLLAIIIITSSTVIYNKIRSKDEKDSGDKATSEIEFLESKLVDLLNDMNNIETRNYNISVSEISKQSKEQKSQNSSSQSGGTQSDSSSSSQQSSSGGGESSTSVSNSTSSQEQDAQKFDLKENGVLTNSDEINWEKVKGQVETLYSSLPTITLDLYQLDINKEDILGFNKEFDNLTVVVKEEKKEETLGELAKLYNYMPKFIDKTEDSGFEKIILDTKTYIFNAYSKLDSKNWQEISNEVRKAIDTYSQLLTNPNVDKSKQYSMSKVYVMINELQNAVEIKDETVFLIKYKNILEEINNL